MNVILASSFGEPLLGILAAFSAGIIYYLTRDVLRDMRAHRKEQRARTRQRKEFWGYE